MYTYRRAAKGDMGGPASTPERRSRTATRKIWARVDRVLPSRSRFTCRGSLACELGSCWETRTGRGPIRGRNTRLHCAACCIITNQPTHSSYLTHIGLSDWDKTDWDKTHRFRYQSPTIKGGPFVIYRVNLFSTCHSRHGVRFLATPEPLTF